MTAQHRQNHYDACRFPRSRIGSRQPAWYEGMDRTGSKRMGAQFLRIWQWKGNTINNGFLPSPNPCSSVFRPALLAAELTEAPDIISITTARCTYPDSRSPRCSTGSRKSKFSTGCTVHGCAVQGKDSTAAWDSVPKNINKISICSRPWRNHSVAPVLFLKIRPSWS